MKTLQNIFNNPVLIRCTFWLVWVLAVCVLVGWNFWDSGYRINSTPSAPRGIYQELPQPPKKGDLASYCPDKKIAGVALSRGYLSAGICQSGVQPLLKRVAGVSGDSLFVTRQGIYINDALWPESASLSQDRQGKPLWPATFPEIIPEGMILLLSEHHSGGFDARYFGLVPLEKTQKVVPILTN